MKVSVVDLANKEVDKLELDGSIFALEPRVDIIKSVIDWQLSKTHRGCHLTKTISEVSGTTKKPFKQKGTGNARQGSLRSVQMRGGGISHGPQVRSYETDLPKKVRKLGLKHALSSKFASAKLFVVNDTALDSVKTKDLKAKLDSFAAKSIFVVSDDDIANFRLACSNLPNVNIVPSIGANVYDLIKHDVVLMSKSAVSSLEKRLK